MHTIPSHGVISFKVLTEGRKQYIRKRVEAIAPNLSGTFNVDQVLRRVQGRPRRTLYQKEEPFTSTKAEVLVCLIDLVLVGVLKMRFGGTFYKAPYRVK